MKKMRVKLTFTTPILGTAPNDQEIYKNYIASNGPDAKSKEEEIATVGVDEFTERGMTVFSRDKDGQPILWDYQIRGFFKAACGTLQKCKGEVFAKESCKIKAYKKIIDGIIFIDERQIPIHMSGEIGILERPLRASTPQGERVALASSEMIPEGSWIEFTITTLSDEYVAAIKEWLDYGIYRGLGQWRNGSYGRFQYELI